MCGRLDQRQAGIAYALAMGWDQTRQVFGDSQAEPRVNTPPGLYRPVFHLVDGERYIDDLHWGYRAQWASKKLPIAINTRLDKITGSYWSRLLKYGRCIVPADGWYEWTGEKGSKQPWHIHPKDSEPIFIAGLAAFGPFREHKAESGFTIITADAGGGMVDVHDRRPVVLTAADAQTWLSPDLPYDEAAHLLHIAGRPPGDFEWHEVSTALNNGTNEQPWLANPIDQPPEEKLPNAPPSADSLF